MKAPCPPGWQDVVEEVAEKQKKMSSKPEVPPKPEWLKTKDGWRRASEVEQQPEQQQEEKDVFGTPGSYHEGD
ncbi:MAG TPA: hypothetical protein VK133_00640 [Amoebophilaceae bacterium]|nr:hypothetical protein [Amoebophilaceae bacterium]